MTACPARRTFAPDGKRGASLITRNRLGAAPQGYLPITGRACPGTRSKRTHRRRRPTPSQGWVDTPPTQHTKRPKEPTEPSKSMIGSEGPGSGKHRTRDQADREPHRTETRRSTATTPDKETNATETEPGRAREEKPKEGGGDTGREDKGEGTEEDGEGEAAATHHKGASKTPKAGATAPSRRRGEEAGARETRKEGKTTGPGTDDKTVSNHPTRTETTGGGRRPRHRANSASGSASEGSNGRSSGSPNSWTNGGNSPRPRNSARGT
eukprot:GGOE01000965.1.p3 GENE.GGOE01000965.1~~GGOE01000965.1.p3  ORF type:complete len:267 (+),score=11.21 GGOE01000965.1:1428-2228(+)